MTEIASPGGVPRVLSLIPPMTQLNTPYPSTAYLTGFLRSRGQPAEQRDLALGLMLRLFSREGLARIHAAAQAVAPLIGQRTRTWTAPRCSSSSMDCGGSDGGTSATTDTGTKAGALRTSPSSATRRRHL